jgi:hypothetical protein
MGPLRELVGKLEGQLLKTAALGWLAFVAGAFPFVPD